MRALVATAILWTALVFPETPRVIVPLELPLLLLLGRFWRFLVPLLIAVLAIRVGDAGMQAAYGRPFDLLTDWSLLPAGWQLARESFGGWVIVFAAVAVAGLVGAVLALSWALRQGRYLALPILALALILPVSAVNPLLVAEKARMLRQSLADLRDFRVAAQVDPFDGAPGLLDALQGRDSAIIFIESYGRASFDNPLYAAHPALLRGAEDALRQSGLTMRSGWLTSPVAGGQSWLAHGTLFSGLRIADQGRYRAMLQSPRRTLFHLAEQAGLHPVAVMPAITLAWPEGPALGFDEILAAKDMGYRGQPLNWVTMPDQYTLSVLEQRLAQPDAVFAGVALISSHAPWVPVIPMRDWDMIGDGSVFDGNWDTRTPEEVWRDQDTIRTQYGASLAYSLQAVTEFAVRHKGRSLLVILGDHQPAGFVSGSDSRDVPVHVIGPPDLVARLDGWGWTDGLVPDPALSPWPMEAFRDRYLNAFTEGARDIAD